MNTKANTTVCLMFMKIMYKNHLNFNQKLQSQVHSKNTGF